MGLEAGNVLPTMDLEGLLLSALAPDLQIQVGSAAEKPRHFTPKMVEPLGWKSFARSPGHHVSPISQLQLLSLGLPH